jgi:hypothetical protein
MFRIKSSGGTVGGRNRKGPDMWSSAPDQNVDVAKVHAADVHRAMQRRDTSKARKPSRVRLILLRLLGRANPPASP